MKNLKEITQRLEANNISVDEYKEDKKLCGYELETWTDGGVNQLVFLDFRNTDMNPKNAAHFLKVYNERVNDIDIDEEVELHRQGEDYKNAFSMTDSIEDFKDWKEKMQGVFANSNKTAQQRQFEQVKDKFHSLLAEMQETLSLMPTKGNSKDDCQKINILNNINILDYSINGIVLEDFTPNEYSGNFELSYS